MRLQPLTTKTLLAASLVIALTTTAASAGPRVSCQSLLAEIETQWVELGSEASSFTDPLAGFEVGTATGMINGGVYLRYDDLALPIDPKQDKPNLIIVSKGGTLELWVYSESKWDGSSYSRKFQLMHAVGTGNYAGRSFGLVLDGKFVPNTGGTYQLSGKMCKSAK